MNWQLSEEDTAQDALARAKAKLANATPGTSNTAYVAATPDGNLQVSIRTVRFEAYVDAGCPGDYDVHLIYSIKPHGATGPVSSKTLITRRRLTASARISGEIIPDASDTDYTLVAVELHRPCGDQPPAHPEIEVHSIKVGLGLGQGAAGLNAGQIRLEAESVTAALYTPAALTVAVAQGGGVEIVNDSSGALRQVKAYQTFADIVTLDATSYQVRFYSLADVGTQDSTTKIYALGGSPYAVFKFENPDTGQSTRLRITETLGSIERVSLYSYDSGAGTWTLSRGNGLRQETLAVSTSGTDTTKVSTIRDANNVVVSKTSKTYRTYGWGSELVQEILDPDGAALTTAYDFYSNQSADGGAYGHLKQQVNADGSWARYTYDSLGRVLKTVRPYLNAAVTAADAACRVTGNSYSTLTDADGDSQPEQLTTIVETTLGTETARAYRIEWSKPVTLGGESFTRRSDIRCVANGAAWNAAGNLATETLSYTTEPFVDRARRVISPDGTATLTTYALDANGQQTAISKSGVPNAALDDITDGSRTTTFTSAQGQVVGESITDIVSGLTLSAWTATQFDALGRPTRFDHADGTYETRDYACCGLASSRDRSGAVTSYLYDALGRQTHVTRGGITTRIAYDADGRVKSVTHIGSDASEMVQSSSVYDVAGRQTERRDALNRLTTVGETFDTASGETTRTTTLADGGTVVEVTARDGSRLSVGGTAAAPRAYEYGFESGQMFTKETLVGEGGATAEWIKTFTDFAGRSSKSVLADGATAESFYNSAGQLIRQNDPDGIAALFAYNAKGEQEMAAVDMNGNGVIDFSGADRITKTTSTVATRDTFTVQRSTTQVWETEGQDTPVTVSVSEQSADGLRSWQTVRGLTTSNVTTLDGAGGRTVTTTAPDGTVGTQVFANYRLQSLVTSHPALGQLSATTYTHDPHGRLQAATDVRTGVTSYTYFADDQLHTSTTPDPDPARSGPGYDPQTTTYAYDSAGRVSTVTHPDGGVVTTEYYPTGQVKKTFGARTYPVEYTYDSQGRVKSLTTWQNFASAAGAAVTTWNYDPQRGFLLDKRYNDDTGPSYTYKPSGRLQTRTWARGIVTTYGYNAAGDLETVDYSDSTPDVTMAYDRAGRPKTINDGAGTRMLSYHESGQLLDEIYSSGLMNGLSVTRTFDSLHRLGSLSASSALSAANQIGYSYDAASRLSVVTHGTNTATYGYLANSPLVESVTFNSGASTRLTTTKVYDNLNRLASITNTTSTTLPAPSFAYDYNSANQRTKATREDNAYWDFGYDALGQVNSAVKKLAGGVALLGHDFGYVFDDIGNRKTATVNSQTSDYTANLLNQYDSRTVPGIIDVFGAAQDDATVTVTHPAATGLPQATIRQGENFYKQLSVDNASAAQYAQVKITGVKNNIGPNGEDAVTEEVRSVLVAGTPEQFTHDTDGNLTADAKWTYTWDGENRLIEMGTTAAAVAAGSPKQKLEFAYDGQSRRIAKNVYDWDGTAWLLGSSTRFLYDGWNMIAELDALSSKAGTRTYVWGLDLSGSMQGAGGVGGLLFANSHLPTPNSAAYAAAFDGNGNVIGLVDMATGAKSATYEYGAFGETLIAEGVAHEQMPFRFSTKFTDSETGLLYYGLRYYSPDTGRWLSRDPISESGGVGLYRFVGNNSISAFDILGREAALEAVFFTVIEGGKSAGPTIAGAGAGTVATAAVVSAALVVTPMDRIIGPPPVLPYDPLDVRPPGPYVNPEFRAPGQRGLPGLQPGLNTKPFADLTSKATQFYFTPFGPDSRAKCAPCLAIIGETFDPRVLAAKQLYPTAAIFDVGPEIPSSFGGLSGANLAWIRGIMDQGCTIIDIGYDSDRGPGKKIPSGIYYQLERFASEGYPKKLFQQFPPTSHYRPSRAGAGL